MKPNDISFLPEQSGCYLFRERGKVIYVGKAKNLKKRVSSYFQKRDLDPKTKLLVSHIEDIDIVVTQNEVEALLLENSLIKKYYPPYNLDLKDSRRYAYIAIRPDVLPWIEVARTRDGEGEYYGPFVSGAIRTLVFNVLTRHFKVLSRKSSPRYRALVDKNAYQERIHAAREILKGKVDELIADYTVQMTAASKVKNYEFALIRKRQIEALQTLKQKQVVEMTRAVNAHIVNYKVVCDEVFLIVFSVRNGILEEKQEYSFAFREGFFEEFLARYYEDAPIPEELILPQRVGSDIQLYLSQKAKRIVSVIVPQKGSKKDLLYLVLKNIDTTFFAGSDRVRALQDALHLPHLPRYVECFDISHLGGTNTVASMVAFTNGLPDKSAYRRFKVKTVDGGDDYRAMKEVVARRYGGSLKSKMKKPDLVVIDGGKGQLHAARDALRSIGVSIPVISLAKRLEEVYIPHKEDPLVLDRKNPGLQMLQAIRDEAHRFAITYQRLLRQKEIQ